MNRTFQEASREPLGEDWGAGEMQALREAGLAGGTALRRAQSNVDPLVAQVRRDLAFTERTVTSLPAGEQREALARAAADLRSQAERAAADVKLPLTAVRGGKVTRRQQGRPTGRLPSDRKVKALHPGRSKKRQRAHQDGEPLEHGDEFQPRPKKGKPSYKVTLRKLRSPHWHACHNPALYFPLPPHLQVRGPTVPDNKDGTFIRNGAAHHRRRKRKAGGR